MALGLIIFVWGQKFLGSIGLPPARGGTGTQRLQRRDYIDVVIWVLGGAAFVWGVVTTRGFLGNAWDHTPSAAKFGLVGIALGAVFWQLFRGSTRDESQRLAVIVILCVFNIFFWMGFEQAGGTMTLFADKQTDRTAGWPVLIVIALAMIGAGLNIYRSTRTEKSGRILWLVLACGFPLFGIGLLIWGGTILSGGGHIEIAASHFQAINPLLIVALAPSFSRLWLRLDQGRLRTSTPTKMAIGMIILGLGFVVMYIGQQLAQTQGKVSSGWLASVYALHTIGELCLSPIGLSMVTKLAPVRVVSLAMGLWFVSSAVANYLAGKLETILESSHLPIYGVLVVSSVGPALLLLALTPMLKRWMHGRA
jgi:POT family proton-dependent oligopeptide transporter